ncbi:MAG: molybdopterin-dependent oxidoreductase [Thermoleophilia bacterium]|jgi:anaerobic selenocysteine-containing dehydrogenase
MARPVKPLKTKDKTTIKGMALGGHGAMPASVDSMNGKIIRIRPLHLDEKYDPKDFNAWKMVVKGVEFDPGYKISLAPFSLAYKKRVYSPNRIKYPLKRVDWDPNGERNPQNRGKSKFERISWEEAAQLIASEIKRVKAEYGPYAILAQGDGHGESKIVHAAHGIQYEFLKLTGGSTYQFRTPDSWEGWYWGAKHVWGMDSTVGLMEPKTNIVKDMAENCEQLLFWACDPETTPWFYIAGLPSRLMYFFKELGIKQIYVTPDLNYGAAIHADKWIPILPNTDAAMQLAVAYVWITEDTYDKEHVARLTVGFDKFADYVLGKEDGVPKTPKWASAKCGVPSYTIKALAREYAKKVTSTIHSFGGSMIRGPYSSEPARLEVVLLAMQGLGKPGVHQENWWKGFPRSVVMPTEATEARQGSMYGYFWPPPPQVLPKTLIEKAIFSEEPFTFYGSGAQICPTSDQFKQYTYPIPKEEGGSTIHMIWSDTPCRTTCWGHGNHVTEGLQHPSIECVVVQHPWLENDTLFADIILPVNTKLEETDFGIDRDAQYFSVFLEDKSVDPIGESKSDYEAVCEVARAMGLLGEFTQGKTIEDWIKTAYELSGVKDLVTWEELREKDYYVVPIAPDWEEDKPGMHAFVEDPQKNPLETPSGLIEIYSEALATNFPHDLERPPIPKWVERGETHDERLSCLRAKKYPLLVCSNHPRWRLHAQCDDIPWTREPLTGKVKGPDGYMYEAAWLNPQEAEKRGIKSGDIVKIFNERGIVLAGAYVTERLRTQVVYIDHGARCDWIKVGEIDRGGAINTISPIGTTSKNAAGQATSGYLVEVEKLSWAEMQRWKDEYPEAFAREYDPASGLRFDAWLA